MLYAVDSDPSSEGVDTAPANVFSQDRFETLSHLSGVFGLIINVVLGVGVAFTVIYLGMGGIKYMTAQGDLKAVQTAREWLTNAVIGFIVVIGSFTIRAILRNILGANTNNISNEIVA